LQHRDFGEQGQQLLGHAVTEILVLRIVTQIREWQHRNRLVHRGMAGGNFIFRVIAGDLRDLCDQSITFFGNCFDVSRFPGIIAQMLS
jgi:hypothetical protein